MLGKLKDQLGQIKAQRKKDLEDTREEESDCSFEPQGRKKQQMENKENLKRGNKFKA